jgi:hypothetical protein
MELNNTNLKFDRPSNIPVNSEDTIKFDNPNILKFDRPTTVIKEPEEQEEPD